MKKDFYQCGIKLILLSVFLFCGCANTSFNVLLNDNERKIDPRDKILLVATSADQSFAEFVRDDVYDGLQKNNFNIIKYPEVLSVFPFNKESVKIESLYKDIDCKYVIRLENIICIPLTGYMPPSQKLETYSYYSNGKLQTGTRTVPVPGYNYTYLEAHLMLNILDAETEKPVIKVQVTTTGSMSAVESHLAKSMAKKITKKLVRVIRDEE